jgi:pterin-4a-carbinolamine dehydratase
LDIRAVSFPSDDREFHHPNFHLVNYREVEVHLWTHKLHGITENDLILAEMLDKEVDVVYSPKWLNDHPEAEAPTTSTS